jgi:hypothetical protein
MLHCHGRDVLRVKGLLTSVRTAGQSGHHIHTLVFARLDDFRSRKCGAIIRLGVSRSCVHLGLTLGLIPDRGSTQSMEEFVKKAAQHRAGARLARVVPYDFDNEEKLDPMALLEEVMQHFYRKAKIEESLGRFCDFRIVDNALQNAARTAREIVSFDAAFLSQGQDRGELGPVLRFPDCRSDVRDGGTDRTRDCELPASEDQCHKAGCRRSQCGSTAWGHDGGRDA